MVTRSRQRADGAFGWPFRSCRHRRLVRGSGVTWPSRPFLCAGWRQSGV